MTEHYAPMPDAGQLADDEAEKWHDAYQDAKRSADRNLAGLTAAITKLEAAEARLQALQPYVQHKSGCPALPANMKRFMSHGCTCGLASLTQPGAASPEQGLQGWSEATLVAALLSDLYRVLDAGGLSCGRSLQSELLEPALALMNRYRPTGNVDRWPSRADVIREARDRVRASLTQPGAAGQESNK